MPSSFVHQIAKMSDTSMNSSKKRGITKGKFSKPSIIFLES